ncbi:hypothetical protein TNCV_2421701 [Trichonephila clavipes]|nr:hypothetical protein TNCV_2421701 [Trichonephila clavipes]
MAVKAKNTPIHDTTLGISVAIHSGRVHRPLTTVSLNLNMTIVMLLAEEGFVSKHSAIPFRGTCPKLIAPLVTLTPVVSSQQ